MSDRPKVRCHFCGCIVRATRLAKHVLDVHGLQDEIEKLSNRKLDEIKESHSSNELKTKAISRPRRKPKLKKKRIKEHMYSWFARMSNAPPMPGGLPSLGKKR